MTNRSVSVVVSTGAGLHTPQYPYVRSVSLLMALQKDDGIYVSSVKEVIDNFIDEHMMGFGKMIDVWITESSR